MSETRQISKLGMPKWGLTMTEGTVIEWLVEEGAELDVGDEVVEVESEKINNVVEAPAAGVLRRRVAAEGDVLSVGGLMGVIADASVPDAEIDAFVEEFQATFVPEEEVAAGPAPETVEVDGRRIQYLKMGEGGTPLIFIPASPETSTSSSSTRRLCPQTAPSTPLTCPAMAAPRRTWERATWTSSPGLWRDFWTRWASRRRTWPGIRSAGR